MEKLNFGRLLTEYRDGALIVEYVGTPDSELDDKLTAAVGSKPIKGGQRALLGSEAERRSFWVFKVSADDVPEIRKRIEDL